MSDIDFLYCDNFLSKEFIENIQNVVIKNQPFYFNYYETNNLKNRPNYVFGNMFEDFPFFTNGSNDFVGDKPIEHISIQIFDEFAKKFNIKNKKIIRAKSNITTKTIEKKPSWPHVDSVNNHFVFLYYVNDSDGDTILYNQKYSGKQYYQNNLKIFKTISPKAGSAIFFNGLYFHTYSAPLENNIRCVINVNLEDISE